MERAFLSQQNKELKKSNTSDTQQQNHLYNKHYSKGKITAGAGIIQRKVHVGMGDQKSEIVEKKSAPTGDVDTTGKAGDKINQITIEEWFNTGRYPGKDEKSKGYTDEEIQKLKKIVNKEAVLYSFAEEEQLKNYLKIKSERGEKEGLKINFINVGQGTASLVSRKDAEKYTLIDAGKNQTDVPDFLKLKGDKYVTAAGKTEPEKKGTKMIKEKISDAEEKMFTIISHDHADHTGAIRGQKENFITDEGQFRGVHGIDKKEAKKEEVLGGTDVIAALGSDDSHKPKQKNNTSLVMFTKTENEIIIFPGDREVEDLCDIIDENLKEEIKGKKVVIAASHHGSITGTDEELLKKFKGAKQVHVVVSAGIDNRHHHPSSPLLMQNQPGEPMTDGSEVKGFEQKKSTGTSGDMDVDQQEPRYSVYYTQNLEGQKGSIVYKAKGKTSAIYSKGFIGTTLGEVTESRKRGNDKISEDTDTPPQVPRKYLRPRRTKKQSLAPVPQRQVSGKPLEKRRKRY